MFLRAFLLNLQQLNPIMLEENKVIHDNWLNNGLPDKSVNLIIADPPYFKTKGEFDFIWKSFEDYLNDVEIWAKECKRLLADNGTLLWYGHAKRIAYAQIIFDKYFSLENSLVWKKKDCQTLKISPDMMRTFAPITERILMYSNEKDSTGYEMVLEEFIKPKNPFSLYLKEEFKKAKVTNIEISKLFPSASGGLTGCVSNWLNGDNVITESQYLKIRNYLNNEFLRKEYEELRKEYEELRRPFNNFNGLQTDVLEYSQESHITKNYDHPTKKPEGLTKALIMTCSRPNDKVLIPFSGSGTEAAICQRLGRKFYAFEIEGKYVKMGNDRILKEHNT